VKKGKSSCENVPQQRKAESGRASKAQPESAKAHREDDDDRAKDKNLGKEKQRETMPRGGK